MISSPDCALSGGATVIKAAAATAATASVERTHASSSRRDCGYFSRLWRARRGRSMRDSRPTGSVDAAARQLCPAGCRGNIRPTTAQSGARSGTPGRIVMRKLIAAVAALVVAGASAAQAAEKLKVAVSQKGFWDSSWIEFGETAGFFKEAGLEIEVFYTEGGAQTIATARVRQCRCRDVESASSAPSAPMPRAAMPRPIASSLAEMTGRRMSCSGGSRPTARSGR